MWNVSLPIRFLPEGTATYFRREAEVLYHDLQENRLQVVLRPAYGERFTGHKVRMVESQNPPWYRELYGVWPHLKRQRTLRSLERIATSGDLPYVTKRGAVSPFGSYDTCFRELIEKRLREGYEFEGRYVEGILSEPLEQLAIEEAPF